MGKTKRACVPSPPPPPPPAPDIMPCSSGMELSLKENCPRSVECNETRVLSPVTDIAVNEYSCTVTDIAVNEYSCTGQHHKHNGFGRSIFLKRSRHSFGHGRNSFHHANASTSHRRFKLSATQYNPNSRTERSCGICQKLLKRRPFNLGGMLELSVIAILVCGHLYHADCLEQRTCLQDRRDPTCPICASDNLKETGYVLR